MMNDELVRSELAGAWPAHLLADNVGLGEVAVLGPRLVAKGSVQDGGVIALRILSLL